MGAIRGGQEGDDVSEIIESITEFDEGYRVKTSEQEIVMQISMSQSCCEQTGYFMSEEDTSGFIGAELLGLSLTDPELRTYTQDELPDTDAGGVMFVTLTISMCVL